jgi:hypothetical protein
MKIVNFVTLAILIGLMAAIAWIHLPSWWAWLISPERWLYFDLFMLLFGLGPTGLCMVTTGAVIALLRHRRGNAIGMFPVLFIAAGVALILMQALVWREFARSPL